MSEYICKEDFLKYIDDIVCKACKACKEGGWDGNDIVCRSCEIMEMLGYANAFPAADVEPVIHARWEEFKDCSNEGVYCSNCHKKVYKIDYSNTMKVKSKYCPNCRAKMDLE